MTLLLWSGILVPPAAFLLHLQINYSLVPWACVTGRLIVLHAATVGTVALAASGSVAAAKAWRRADGGRSEFMAFLGIMGSALFLLVIIAQAIPVFIIGPCQK
jgi:hypothetical protein